MSLEKIQEALLKVGISEGLKKPVGKFSGGMKRRVAVVRAVLSVGNFLKFLLLIFLYLILIILHLIDIYLLVHALLKSEFVIVIGAEPPFSVVFQENRLCEAFDAVENIRLVTGKRLSLEKIQEALLKKY